MELSIQAWSSASSRSIGFVNDRSELYIQLYFKPSQLYNLFVFTLSAASLGSGPSLLGREKRLLTSK